MKPCKSIPIHKYHIYMFDDWTTEGGRIVHYWIYANDVDEARDIVESNISSGVSWIITNSAKKIIEEGRMRWNPAAGEQYGD